MKIVVTGANGQLGREILTTKSTHQIIGLSRAQLDITQTDQIKNTLFKLTPDLIINAAAYTQVDKAEQEQAQAIAINASGAANLAHYCAVQNIPLLHVSTDYVFSGTKNTPYTEDDITQPINVYGKSKLEGEQAIQKILDNFIILRVSGVFGFHGNNFVKTILKLAREREQLKVIADTIICPTPACAIADILLRMVDFMQNKAEQKNVAGVYHYCSDEPTSWFNYAKEIISQASAYEKLLVKEVLPVPTTEYPTPAKRPAYSVLDTQKIQKQFAIPACSWQEGLSVMLKRLYS